MTIQLTESASLGKVTGKRRWYSRLIAAGAGSSAYHSEDALRNTGASAWPMGTKVYFNHATESEDWERPEGDLRNLAGIIATTPEYRDDVDIPGLYADVEIGEEYGPFVEQFAEFIGLSIRAGGWGDQVTENGQRIIEGYIPSVLNSVDLVTAAGAKGKLIEAIESFDGEIPPIVEKSGTIASESDKTQTNDRKEKGMTEEDIQAVAEAVAKAIAPSFDSLKEALAPAPVEEDADGEVDLPAVTESLIESGLAKVARERVFKAIESGVSVEDAIASEKEYSDSLREAFVAEAEAKDDSKIVESAKAQPSVLTVKGL